MAETGVPVFAGLGVGLALAGAPGPVQAVLIAEAARGGIARGFRALAGASLTFGALLAALALGLSVSPPSGAVLRALRVAGGGVLLWLALDGIRTTGRDAGGSDRRSLPPVVRGSLAVLINPGAWLFLAAVASPLLGDAARADGTGRALVAAGALMAGAALGDCMVVLLGGLGVRKAGRRVEIAVRRALAVVLAGLGVWLIARGVFT